MIRRTGKSIRIGLIKGLMPLYECYCERCELTFEALAPLSAASAPSHPCPRCEEQARRILSAVVFGRAAGERAEPLASKPADASRPDVTRLRVPPPAQLCWMDRPSRARYAAYVNGRGKEYDETVAARTEAAKNQDPPIAKAPAAAHSHDQSPLADPVVYERRRAAAARTQTPESTSPKSQTPTD